MQKRVMTVALGAVLCLGAFAVAQTLPFTVQADRIVREAQWGLAGRTAPVPVQTTLTGHVSIQVNGVLVRADRAVWNEKDRELALEGNVRLTLPQPK
jgi:lipopolysaccharide assembly outer membrane protein LptD (OstA)